ncbi:DUF2250 domain-containing protein [Caldivirga maquilingensis]|uniref:DUF2250 domain-containing protein n=1 Tax=Caldivirga maquilingensis (strain ATCC 700844 / DSM 13496 / JCM 10307 / IC-167) TaxID=397948 RepID=A8M9U9_CALMQ|nr:DUF2250 domain-containing protein [Caldivirga maquilingensis]ABW02420.1 conserved hypothetical protein [Caldivirga maquilingensis IC-167]
MNELTDKDIAVLVHLKKANVDYGKSIALNTGIPLQEVLQILDKLEYMGLVERVKGGKTLKRSVARFKLSSEVRRHHVYYRLSRSGELLIRASVKRSKR